VVTGVPAGRISVKVTLLFWPCGSVIVAARSIVSPDTVVAALVG
jgi:hypothetical protein